jgi:hypothetical protein
MSDQSDRRDQQLDPGAYIGRKPELAAETIPGGVQPDDERVAAGETQTGADTGEPATPSGHREGDPASDDDAREAGLDR